MKKLLLLFAFIGAMFVMSCEQTIEPPISPCERDNVGTVTVKNSTGRNIWVDITWGSISENYEKLLYNNNTYKYSNVRAGSIECWVSLDGNDWIYKYESLRACQDMIYTWYLTGKKSTEVVQEYYVEVTDGNGKLIRTMTQSQFQKGNK